jgi:ABC-type glycerol-3-phosphate transport system permease component
MEYRCIRWPGRPGRCTPATGNGALTVTLSSTFVAFGFAHFRFRGRNVLFDLVLATMMPPTAVTMIPTTWSGTGWG